MSSLISVDTRFEASVHGCKVKGTATLALRETIDRQLGSGWFDRKVSQVDPGWPERILPGDWYALEPQLVAMREALQRHPEFGSIEELASRAAGLAAEQDLGGIYRAFLWVANPRVFLSAVPRIWSTYCQFGSATVLTNERGLFRLRAAEIPESLIDWAAGAYLGFLPPALLLVGAKEPRATILDRRRSVGATTWEMIYELHHR